MTATRHVAQLLFGDPAEWQRRSRSDPVACALADRHYSRQTVGSRQIGPPGRTLVFVTADESALWLTSWPEYPMDCIDAWRCSIFRNEGDALSSTLIRSAMDLTATYWADRPSSGLWLTFVDTAAVASPNPGFCFLKAGWRRDRSYRPDRRRSGLRRFLADTPRRQVVSLDERRSS